VFLLSAEKPRADILAVLARPELMFKDEQGKEWRRMLRAKNTLAEYIESAAADMERSGECCDVDVLSHGLAVLAAMGVRWNDAGTAIVIGETPLTPTQSRELMDTVLRLIPGDRRIPTPFESRRSIAMEFQDAERPDRLRALVMLADARLREPQADGYGTIPCYAMKAVGGWRVVPDGSRQH
jgi:hypothetical protein